MQNDELLKFRMVRTMKRLVFEIQYQSPRITYNGPDDGDYFYFKASNKYEVISRSRMDIQTERMWLLGACNNVFGARSGSMIFDNNEKRDKAYNDFLQALDEWSKHNGGYVTRVFGED